MNLAKREYILIGVVIVLLCLLSLSFFSSFFNEYEEENEEWSFGEELEEVEQLEEEVVLPQPIMVDVKGAVAKPGVYSMKEGDRVVDVIERAGGVIEEADTNQINFAEILVDEMVVYVPLIGEGVENIALGGSVAVSGSSNDSQGKVRINYATAEELEQLSGIGPSKASAIIAYREENGPFKVEEDLLQVTGIGPKSFEQLKDQITVK